MILATFLKVYSGEIRVIELTSSAGKAGFRVLFQGFEEDVPLRFKTRHVISIHSVPPYVITALIAREDNQ